MTSGRPRRSGSRPARRSRQLTAVGDWGELLFATNIVFEQLVGQLFRSELVMQIAARNGDYITPTHRRHRRERLRP